MNRILKRVKQMLGAKNENFDDIIYFQKYNAVYFPIPKVANSSLKAVSAQLLGDVIPNHFKSDKWLPFPFRNEEARQELRRLSILIDYSTFEKLKGCYSFTFVRNPWDRVVSCYTNKIIDPKIVKSGFENGVAKPLQKFNCFYGGMAFDEFVKCICKIPDELADIHFKSQYQFIENNKGKSVVDFIGKFESLFEDFEIVKKKTGFPSHIELPHLLKSERADYQSYYTTELIDMISKRYKKDIEIFQYSFY
jgi:predicted DNA-binding antitoxin AbrB/MazE fold protein